LGPLAASARALTRGAQVAKTAAKTERQQSSLRGFLVPNEGALLAQVHTALEILHCKGASEALLCSAEMHDLLLTVVEYGTRTTAKDKVPPLSARQHAQRATALYSAADTLCVAARRRRYCRPQSLATHTRAGFCK